MQDLQSLEQAKSFFISGLEKLNSNNLSGAEIDFETSLKFAPNRLSTLINLSIVLIKLKKFENAEKLINEGLLHHPKNKELLMGLVEIYEKLLINKPEFSQAHVKLGNAYSELNMYEESLTAYKTALALEPILAENYDYRANKLESLKKYQEALSDYDAAIQINSDYSDVFSHSANTLEEQNRVLASSYLDHGNILKDIKRLDEALSSYDRAIKIIPNYVEAYTNRGIVLRELKRLDQAVASYDRAIEINPDYAEAYSNRGIALRELKRLDEAVASYDRAIKIKPDYAEAYSNRGNALKDLKRLDEAIASYDRAIQINPNYAEAYYNRGVYLNEIEQLEQALASYALAIKINPSYAEAYTNKGVVLQELMLTDEAMSSYDTAIVLDPEYAEAYHNKAMLLLLNENLNDGWFFYKWRWKIKDKYSRVFHTKIPYWDGRSSGKQIKILFWGEQGIGDEIFYFGMLKNFTEINAQISIAADNRLHSLFRRSMPEVEFIDSKKIDIECDENSFDYQGPMGDIGLLCSVDKVIEHKLPKPFLNINKLRNSDIKNKNNIFNKKIVCGLSWKSANHNIGLSKSIDLIDLSPLLLIENLEFVSLQYGSTKDEIEFVEKNIGKKIHTIDGLDLYNDIDGLVSLIDSCNFVVTTSNITAHLAGSIGKNGMVLLPFSKGKIWYWHSGEGQSVWYPSLELVSQKQMNDWTHPITKCKEWTLEQLSF